MTILAISNLISGYGDMNIIQKLNLKIESNEIVTIMGRNGVGKTTLMKTIVGLVRTKSGSIKFKGEDVTRFEASKRATKGMGYVPQGRGIFPRLTVKENLQMGLLIGSNPGTKNAPTRGRNNHMDLVFECFPILKEREKQYGGTLSGGQQQMLAIGRAIVGDPDLLVLDEPSEGVQPSIVQEIAEDLKKLRDELRIAVLIVEQNINLVMSLSEQCYIMDKGKIVHELNKNEFSDQRLLSHYLAV